MDVDKFQEKIAQQDIVNHDAEFYLKGMIEELGEIMGIEKRMERGDYVNSHGMRYPPSIQLDQKEEIGDFAWYFIRFCSKRGIRFSECLDLNDKKVTRRLKEGTILGSGNR